MMKKLSAIMVASLLALATAFSAFAAGINENEQAVLDELNTTVTMNGGTMSIPSEFINQAESYFNTIDMTAEESSAIIAIIKDGESFLASSGASNIADLTLEQKETLLSYGESAVGVIGMSMSYDTSSKTLTITDPEGKTAYSAVPTLTTNASSGSTKTDSNGGSSTSLVSDSAVIKTTGSNVSVGGIAMLGGVALVLAAGGAFYLVKTKKERA